MLSSPYAGQLHLRQCTGKFKRRDLDVLLFEGDKAETKTLIPVIEQFKTRHGIDEQVVVADAGMLSADNLNTLEDARYRFIVASRQSHVPYDLSDHFEPTQLHPDDSTIDLTSLRFMVRIWSSTTAAVRDSHTIQLTPEPDAGRA